MFMREATHLHKKLSEGKKELMRLTKMKIVSGAFMLAAALLLGVGVVGFAQADGRRRDGSKTQ